MFCSPSTLLVTSQQSIALWHHRLPCHSDHNYCFNYQFCCILWENMLKSEFLNKMVSICFHSVPLQGSSWFAVVVFGLSRSILCSSQWATQSFAAMFAFSSLFATSSIFHAATLGGFINTFLSYFPRHDFHVNIL